MRFANTLLITADQQKNERARGILIQPVLYLRFVFDLKHRDMDLDLHMHFRVLNRAPSQQI